MNANDKNEFLKDVYRTATRFGRHRWLKNDSPEDQVHEYMAKVIEQNLADELKQMSRRERNLAICKGVLNPMRGSYRHEMRQTRKVRVMCTGDPLERQPSPSQTARFELIEAVRVALEHCDPDDVAILEAFFCEGVTALQARKRFGMDHFTMVARKQLAIERVGKVMAERGVETPRGEGELLTLQEAMRYKGVGQRTIASWYARGQLERFEMGGRGGFYSRRQLDLIDVQLYLQRNSLKRFSDSPASVAH